MSNYFLSTVLILLLFLGLLMGMLQGIGAYKLQFHEDDYSDQRENLIINTIICVIGSLLLLGLCYHNWKTNIGIDSNWITFLAFVLLLGMGIYSTMIALDLQCHKQENDNLLTAWTNSKNSALIGIIGSFVLLVVILIKRREFVYKSFS